jgi:choline kinase
MSIQPRIIILADGLGSRWTIDTPKHLAVVDGEPVLLRTVRQLVERELTDLWLTSRLERYDALQPFVQRYVPIDNRFKLDQFYACREIWLGHKDVVFLYGDVRFTDAAIDTILKAVPRDFVYFQRTFGSVITGKCCKEGFAMRIGNTQRFETLLKHMRIELENNRIAVADHQVQGYLEGRGMGEFSGIGSHGIEIDDETDDFDFPADVKVWTENVTQWRQLDSAAQNKLLRDKKLKRKWT